MARRTLKNSIVALVALALLGGAGFLTYSLLLHTNPKLISWNPVHLHLPGAVSRLPSFALPQATNGDRINILIMGLDRREGLVNYDRPFPAGNGNDPGLTDTMAVVSIDPRQKTVTVMSIPRDLWLEIPDGSGGWTTGRINNAYYVGSVRNLPGGGPGAAMAAIKHNFGISIDHYVLLDFNGFMRIIDAVGGIDINVPNTFAATVLPKADDGGYEYMFLAGKQHLDGELALAYARFRFDPEGDFGRIKRQQQVALAVRKRARSLGWATHALSLYSAYRDSFETDLPSLEVPGYALLASQINSNSIQSRSLGEAGATTAVTLPSGADVLFPNPEAMAQIIGTSFDDRAMETAAYASLARARQSANDDLVASTRRPPSVLANP